MSGRPRCVASRVLRRPDGLSSDAEVAEESEVVKIDHEQILCNNRVKVVAELAPSFELLMLHTINKAGDN
jgi:hypothetical protein